MNDRIYQGHAGQLLALAEQETTEYFAALDELDGLPWWRWRLRARIHRRALYHRDIAVGLVLRSERMDQ